MITLVAIKISFSTYKNGKIGVFVLYKTMKITSVCCIALTSCPPLPTFFSLFGNLYFMFTPFIRQMVVLVV